MFAAGGDLVVVVDPSAPAAASLAESIVADGGAAVGARADLASLDDMVVVADTVAGHAGSVEVLVNCHFAIAWSSIEETSIDEWVDVLHTNILGPIVASKAFLPLLKEAGSSAIVHLGSVDGLHGNPPSRRTRCRRGHWCR